MDTAAVEVPWAIVLILLPLGAGIVSFIIPALARLVGIGQSILLIPVVIALGVSLQTSGVYRHAVGGWGAPLGIDLYADGLSLLMLGTTSLVCLAVAFYALRYFDDTQARKFWPLFMILTGALNALFLSADIFNLYVTLELVGLASVTLVTLSGTSAAYTGAMRYLAATLMGSLGYLLGVTLLYHGFATVDLTLLAERVDTTAVVWMALVTMSIGLLLKTALVPLHFWLPPAHASAPAPVSALLSALVVKASFYILLRLWILVFEQLGGPAAATFGALGCASVLWGSWQAIRQTRVKMMIAYSTVAQLGYLLIAFPLGVAVGWGAVAYLAISHALAKASMFLAAGNLIRYGGHDRIEDLDRVAHRLPVTTCAFAIAALSIMGLPPSGGFVAKWMLLEASLLNNRWDLAIVLIVGGILAAIYIFRVLGKFFMSTDDSAQPGVVPAAMEWTAVFLATAAMVLGFLAPWLLPLINIGDPFLSGGTP